MPTTNALMAQALLDALEDTGVPYAVLHRESDAAAGLIESDIDVALGRPPLEVLPALMAALSHTGAGLALIWPYDVNSLNTFWLSRDCRSGVQLDLLCDPLGRGKYGLRTDAVLQHTERGERWMRLTPEVEQAYLVSKRWAKADVARLDELISRAAGRPSADLTEEMFAERAARAVGAAYAGQKTPRGGRLWPNLRGLLSVRTASRLAHPVGVLVRLRGEATLGVARDLSVMLDRVVVASDISTGRSLSARAARFIRLRRPHILLCVDDVGTRPDVEVTVTCPVNLDEVVNAVWQGLVDDARRKMEVWSSVGGW
ncbi:MAG: hypothetical protein ACRDRK_15805 [Pseudonocardia sp.]